MTAQGLSGVRLAIAGAHRGPVGATGAALPGAGSQRCRTHYLRDLLDEGAQDRGDRQQAKRRSQVVLPGHPHMGLGSTLINKFDTL